MDKIRKTLGWLYCSIGLILLLFAALALKDTPDANLTTQVQAMYLKVLAGALIYNIAGLSLLRNSRYSPWICLPLALLSLLYFPFGTVTGALYLWYYWKFVYRRP